MAKRRMMVTDNQLLIDMDLFFNTMREAKGNWEQVEKDLAGYRDSVVAMSGESAGPSTEPKTRMLIRDDQLIIDATMLFNAIREAKGNWEQVEGEMRSLLEMAKNMAG